MLVGYLGFAQNEITGNVADDNSLALPGATVVVEGTSNGVTTDFWKKNGITTLTPLFTVVEPSL